jgi:predicted transcriptional regulator
MNIAATKLELAKQLLDTNDKDLINHIKAIFSTREENWFEELPEEVQASVKRGLKQAKEGDTIPHAEVMKRYKKWLKK